LLLIPAALSDGQLANALLTESAGRSEFRLWPKSTWNVRLTNDHWPANPDIGLSEHIGRQCCH